MIFNIFSVLGGLLNSGGEHLSPSAGFAQRQRAAEGINR